MMTAVKIDCGLGRLGGFKSVKSVDGATRRVPGPLRDAAGGGYAIDFHASSVFERAG
jgi:hypothetical protein